MKEAQYKILNPIKFGGSIDSDWGFEIDGVKSEKSYVSKKGAENAMFRKLQK